MEGIWDVSVLQVQARVQSRLDRTLQRSVEQIYGLYVSPRVGRSCKLAMCFRKNAVRADGDAGRCFFLPPEVVESAGATNLPSDVVTVAMPRFQVKAGFAANSGAVAFDSVACLFSKVFSACASWHLTVSWSHEWHVPSFAKQEKEKLSYEEQRCTSNIILFEEIPTSVPEARQDLHRQFKGVQRSVSGSTMDA